MEFFFCWIAFVRFAAFIKSNWKVQQQLQCIVFVVHFKEIRQVKGTQRVCVCKLLNKLLIYFLHSGNQFDCKHFCGASP